MREVSLENAELSDVSAEVLGKGGLFCFKAHGSSMYPFIRDGDVLTVQPVQPDMLNRGDVVFYRSNRYSVVAHRVVRKNSRNGKLVFAIRGDSGLNKSEQIPAEHVLGRVMSIQRGQKTIQFDNIFWKLIPRLWVAFYPLSFLFLRAIIRIKRVAFFSSVTR